LDWIKSNLNVFQVSFHFDIKFCNCFFAEPCIVHVHIQKNILTNNPSTFSVKVSLIRDGDHGNGLYIDGLVYFVVDVKKWWGGEPFIYFGKIVF
jgi:hypothetical protein